MDFFPSSYHRLVGCRYFDTLVSADVLQLTGTGEEASPPRLQALLK